MNICMASSMLLPPTPPPPPPTPTLPTSIFCRADEMLAESICGRKILNSWANTPNNQCNQRISRPQGSPHTKDTQQTTATKFRITFVHSVLFCFLIGNGIFFQSFRHISLMLRRLNEIFIFNYVHSLNFIYAHSSMDSKCLEMDSFKCTNEFPAWKSGS